MEIDVQALLTIDEKCTELGVTRQTLRRWREAGTGPTFVQHGGTVRYHPEPTRDEAEQSRVAL